jgi:peptidoglycan/LPS O-acetylase OafA/YrhL
MGMLRLILACAVLLVHAGSFFRFNITAGGQFPVELFYIISGFYMALVLNEKYVGAGSARAFYANRMLRLLPAYWVLSGMALAIYLYIYLVTGGGYIAWMADLLREVPAWKSLFLVISNTFLVGINWLPELFPLAGPKTAVLIAPAWTLGVELCFYALAPLLVRGNPWILAWVLAGSVGLRLAYFLGLDLGAQPWSYHFFPFELALFTAGALSYRLYCRLRDTGSGNAIFGLSLVVAVLLFQLMQKGVTLSLCNCDAVTIPLRTIFYIYAAVAIAYLFNETRNNRIDTSIGELSYLVYLAHYPLIDFYNVIVRPDDSMTQASIRSAVILVVSLALAYIVYRYIERPVDALRHRRYRAPALAQSA